MANSIDFPGKIGAGLNFSASATLPDNAAPAWTVTAILRGAGSINLTAVGNGSDFVFSVPGATTATWTPGSYWVSVRASNGTDNIEVAQRQITVAPDLAAADAGYDGRSQNEIALDAINAVMAKRATMDQQRYTINNRELWRTPMADLIKLRSFYATAVRRERRKALGITSFGRNISVRFSQ